MAKIDLTLIYTCLCTFRNASQNEDRLYNGCFFHAGNRQTRAEENPTGSPLPDVGRTQIPPPPFYPYPMYQNLLLGPVTRSLIIWNKYETPTARVKIPQVAMNEVSVRAGRSSKKSVL